MNGGSCILTLLDTEDFKNPLEWILQFQNGPILVGTYVLTIITWESPLRSVLLCIIHAIMYKWLCIFFGGETGHNDLFFLIFKLNLTLKVKVLRYYAPLVQIWWS